MHRITLTFEFYFGKDIHSDVKVKELLVMSYKQKYSYHSSLINVIFMSQSFVCEKQQSLKLSCCFWCTEGKRNLFRQDSIIWLLLSTTLCVIYHNLFVFWWEFVGHLSANSVPTVGQQVYGGALQFYPLLRVWPFYSLFVKPNVSAILFPVQAALKIMINFVTYSAESEPIERFLARLALISVLLP